MSISDPKCPTCLGIRWLEFTAKDGWTSPCPRCNTNGTHPVGVVMPDTDTPTPPNEYGCSEPDDCERREKAECEWCLSPKKASPPTDVEGLVDTTDQALTFLDTVMYSDNEDMRRGAYNRVSLHIKQSAIALVREGGRP